MPIERIEDRIKRMIVERLELCDEPSELQDDDDLLSKWHIDDGLMEIVIGVEGVFGIRITIDEFSLKKFRTVKNIAEVVRGKGVS